MNCLYFSLILNPDNILAVPDCQVCVIRVRAYCIFNQDSFNFDTQIIFLLIIYRGRLTESNDRLRSNLQGIYVIGGTTGTVLPKRRGHGTPVPVLRPLVYQDDMSDWCPLRTLDYCGLFR